MKTIALGKTPSRKRRPVRAGRPPREFAGEVDARILDAARSVFFERGLAGASMDEIAARAGAGKPTIYARFPNKEALFTAVVMRDVEARIARFQAYSPTGANIEERLADLGRALLQWVLVGDTIGLMRLAIAEARRFPDLASSVSRMARERGIEPVARLLAEVARSDELGPVPAFAPERLPTTARFFLDLILSPLLMRALLGERLDVLRAEIEPHAARSAAFFLAGCRHGGDEWPKGRS
ncbi:MAG TPA: TetR/AcrR family transcriptional regulator [Acetobacteraceae bacterium]|nr:TetR/AcrR family transcriptional regulator [Acetobacteraceae bacterium]